MENKEMPNDLKNKQVEKEKTDPKGLKKDSLKKPQVTKNQVFDKHSGTGRGKEISKGGAGGKYTWGQGQKQLEKEAYNDDEEEDYPKKEPGDIKKEFA